MAKYKKAFFILLVVVLLVLGIVIGLWVAGNHQNSDGSADSGYSAVYMAQGAIYFGKLSWFPTPHMSDVLVLQQGSAENGQPSGVSLVPFKNAFWGPVGDVYLNQAQIVFWAPIRSDSQVAQVLANPSLLVQQNQTGQPTMPEGSTTIVTTSTTN